MNLSGYSPLAQYIIQVTSDDIVVNKWVKLAVQRHLNDIERSENDPGFPFYFNDDLAQKAIDFFSFLRHSKGEWRGKPFILEPWQHFIVGSLFGWVKKEDDMRRFRNAYISVARKNGKTQLAAGIGLYLLDGDGEGGSEVYAAATKLDQAKLCHGEAVAMVKQAKELNAVLKLHINNIFNVHTNSFFRPLGRDSSSMDGLNSHGIIVDELHAHKTRDLYDVLDTSTSARRQSLLLSITTAGFNKMSICYELESHCMNFLSGTVQDDSMFGIIYGIDDGDDWGDRKVWVKANPNLNVSVKENDIEQKYNRANSVASARNAFLRLHLNQWTDSFSSWIPVEKWLECGETYAEEDLHGKICYGGLDLASTRDITAFVLVFPVQPGIDKLTVLPRFFLPNDTIAERELQDKAPYTTFKRSGDIMVTGGNTVDHNYIIKKIIEDSELYDMRDIAYDPWGATLLVQRLEEHGFNSMTAEEAQKKNARQQRGRLIKFRQGFQSYNYPTKEFEKIVYSKKIRHNGNAALNWMVRNVTVVTDDNENMRPTKSKSVEKIDGVVAMIMALDRCVRNDVKKQRAVVPFFV